MKYFILRLYFLRLIGDKHFQSHRLSGILKMKIHILCFSFLLYSTLYAQVGTVYNKSITIDSVVRNYILYVPTAYDGSEKWPLVINYHGYSGNAKSQMDDISLMNNVADTAHFLVVYPEGLQVELLVSVTGLPNSAAGWNVPGIFKAAQNDIAFTDSLIDAVQRDFKIDLSRIHATGWSNGSMMSFYLAGVRPDRIASIAGVAGPMTSTVMDSFSITRPFSGLLMHGTADSIVPFYGIQDVAPPAPVTPAFWARQNNCSLDSSVTELPDLDTSDNSTVILIKYDGCDENTEVLFYLINNGGHGWPGGPSFPLIGNTNQDINASSEIWNFFKRNPHPYLFTSIGDINTFVTSIELYSNYPNPFNPGTTINYDLSSTVYVELKIYNQLGQMIRVLENSRRSMGRHKVFWDGKDKSGISMASGIYFYKLKAGSFIKTRKMILLK